MRSTVQPSRSVTPACSSASRSRLRISSSKPRRMLSPRCSTVTATPSRDEEAGEFERDIAAADDKHALGQAGQVEDLVGGDAEFAAGYGRVEGGVAAGRDQDVTGADDLAAAGEAHAVGAGDHRPLLADGDFRPFQPLAVKAGEPRHLVGDGVAQRRPIEARLGQRPAEARRILEVLGEAAGVDEELLGHAAADHAGAADAVFFRDHHAGPMARGDAGRARAARPGADDEKIHVEISHCSVLLARVRAALGRAQRFAHAATARRRPGRPPTSPARRHAQWRRWRRRRRTAPAAGRSAGRAARAGARAAAIPPGSTRRRRRTRSRPRPASARYGDGRRPASCGVLPTPPAPPGSGPASRSWRSRCPAIGRARIASPKLSQMSARSREWDCANR